jgi:plasmid stabilization system protein ParE
VKRSLQRADCFWADLARQVDWYRDEACPEVAERFVDAVEATLNVLMRQPGLGRARFQKWPELQGIRSFRVRKPFHRFLIFYRHEKPTLFAERLIHGGRDLPRRLLESPFAAEP